KKCCIAEGKAESTRLISGYQRIDIYPAPGTVEAHASINPRKNCIIPPESDVFPRQKFCAALPHNDIAGDNPFAAEFFHTQPLADAVAAILNAALSFFMSHTSVRR